MLFINLFTINAGLEHAWEEVKHDWHSWRDGSLRKGINQSDIKIALPYTNMKDIKSSLKMMNNLNSSKIVLEEHNMKQHDSRYFVGESLGRKIYTIHGITKEMYHHAQKNAERAIGKLNALTMHIQSPGILNIKMSMSSVATSIYQILYFLTCTDAPNQGTYTDQQVQIRSNLEKFIDSFIRACNDNIAHSASKQYLGTMYAIIKESQSIFRDRGASLNSFFASYINQLFTDMRHDQERLSNSY